MKRILVIGASGFVGGHLARKLLADGHTVRCLARNPDKVRDLAGCEIVRGDMSDAASLNAALDGIDAVYISIHTLSPQQSGAGDFMDVEMAGLQNIVTAAKAHGATRIIYVTSLGIAQDAESSWLRGRWKTEQFLLTSGLDATVIRPGMIVGGGGRGFGTVVSQAKKRVALNLLSAGHLRMRSIAIDDLVYYLTGVLEDPRSYGQHYDVGCDDAFSNNRMIDIVADILGRPHPIKIDFPHGILRALAPLIERMAKLPKGAIKGFLGSMTGDGIGDPRPIRAILPRTPLSFRDSAEKALRESLEKKV